MLGLKSLIHQPIPSFSRPISIPLHTSPSLLKLQHKTLKAPSTRVLVFAQNNSNNKNNNLTKEPNSTENQQQPKNGFANNGGGDEDMKKDRRPIFNFKLGDLLDPDPDNILAVGLTGILAWASVQVLSQLFFVSLAILVAALKYTFIAALLIFILITLL